MNSFDAGQVIAGKYELVRRLGRGAMGEVWAAKHATLDGEFALKLLRPCDEPDVPQVSGRFQLEAQLSAKLSRKTRHIVSVSDHGEESELAYLVMELLEGEPLDVRLARERALSLPETVGIVRQITRALAIAHADGVLHRDLKPSNIFLTRDPEDGKLLVKVVDFGIARSLRPVRTRSPFQTHRDMVLGTPSYMSPEQARGLESLDHRCDVWALAVTAYESLAGVVPWRGDTVEEIFLAVCTHAFVPIRERNPALPKALEAVFERAFAEPVGARFASAEAFCRALETLVDPKDVELALGPAKKPEVDQTARLPRARSGASAAVAAPPSGGPGEPASVASLGVAVDVAASDATRPPGALSGAKPSVRSRGASRLAYAGGFVATAAVVFGIAAFAASPDPPVAAAAARVVEPAPAPPPSPPSVVASVETESVASAERPSGVAPRAAEPVRQRAPVARPSASVRDAPKPAPPRKDERAVDKGEIL